MVTLVKKFCRACVHAWCRRFAVYSVARYVFVNKNSACADLGKGGLEQSPVASPWLQVRIGTCFSLRSFTVLTSYKEV